MRKSHKKIGLGLFIALLLCGCQKKPAEDTGILNVQEAEKPEIRQTEEQAAAALNPDTMPGTVLGEEEVLVLKEDSFESVLYERVRGLEGSSIAYDAERFFLEIKDGMLVIRFRDKEEVFLAMGETEGDSAEAAADQYVYDSGEECAVEEVTIGEGEYPAFWVRYGTETPDGEKVCDRYILRHNERLYVVQIDCSLDLCDTAGAEQQTILSTLRFDEG